MSDGARIAYGTLTCTHQRVLWANKWENKDILFGPEVYEAFYDLAGGIHVNSETEFVQHIDHLFGTLVFCLKYCR